MVKHNIHNGNDDMLLNEEVSSNSVDTDEESMNVIFPLKGDKAVDCLTNGVSVLNKQTLNLEESAVDNKNANNSSIGSECPFPNMSFENSGSKPVGHTTASNFNKEKQYNNISKFLALRSKIDDAISGSFNHQKHVSENKISSRRGMKYSVTSTSGIINQITICYKLFVIIAVCFTVAIFLLPIILYYVNRTASNTEDTSFEKVRSKPIVYS